MHEETPVRRESVSHQGIPYTPKPSKENVSRSSSARKQRKHSTMMEHAADYRPLLRLLFLAYTFSSFCLPRFMCCRSLCSPLLKCMQPCTACSLPCTLVTDVHSLCIFRLGTSVKERFWLSQFSAATMP